MHQKIFCLVLGGISLCVCFWSHVSFGEVKLCAFSRVYACFFSSLPGYCDNLQMHMLFRDMRLLVLKITTLLCTLENANGFDKFYTRKFSLDSVKVKR